MGLKLNCVVVRGNIHPPVTILDIHKNKQSINFYSNTIVVRPNSFDLFLAHNIYAILTHMDKLEEVILKAVQSSVNSKLDDVRIVNYHYSAKIPYTIQTLVSQFVQPLLQLIDYQKILITEEAAVAPTYISLQQLLGENTKFIDIHIEFKFGKAKFQHSKCKKYINVTVLSNNFQEDTIKILNKLQHIAIKDGVV
jgi:hypothetical protein